MEKTIYLKGLQAGDIMCWDVFAQCGNTLEVSLKGNNTTYFDYQKSSGYYFCELLGQGNDVTKDENLCLTVNFDNTSNIKVNIYSQDVIVEGEYIGKVFNVCFEDSADNDYNDLYINVCSWHKKG